jgi:Tfp pilus assembly PilM family ATPase
VSGLGIANNRIGVRTFELSGIDDPKQLENAIRFRAHEALPIPIEQAVLDWQVLDEWQDESGGITRRILLVVAYREAARPLRRGMQKAGIKLVGVDLEAFALLRAIAEPLPRRGRAHERGGRSCRDRPRSFDVCRDPMVGFASSRACSIGAGRT